MEGDNGATGPAGPTGSTGATGTFTPVVMSASKLNTQIINNFVKLAPWSTLIDTASSFNPTTGDYTIPVSGTYAIATDVKSTNRTGDSSVAVYILINNTQDTQSSQGTAYGTANALTQTTSSIYSIQPLVAGDIVSIFGTVTNSASATISASYLYTRWSIVQIS
ncbi:hypothetical protein CN585_27750 [Bacillus toyonensis]|uniref:Collagen-like protein n=1 Tax=Bacillus toyonensis TaxID=155322 RepID=A0A2A8H8P6_9BACI|nr:hypothetical protein CN585_27750 [Bacillus toyonensis]